VNAQTSIGFRLECPAQTPASTHSNMTPQRPTPGRHRSPPEVVPQHGSAPQVKYGVATPQAEEVDKERSHLPTGHPVSVRSMGLIRRPRRYPLFCTAATANWLAPVPTPVTWKEPPGRAGLLRFPRCHSPLLHKTATPPRPMFLASAFQGDRPLRRGVTQTVPESRPTPDKWPESLGADGCRVTSRLRCFSVAEDGKPGGPWASRGTRAWRVRLGYSLASKGLERRNAKACHPVCDVGGWVRVPDNSTRPTCDRSPSLSTKGGNPNRGPAFLQTVPR